LVARVFSLLYDHTHDHHHHLYSGIIKNNSQLTASTDACTSNWKELEKGENYYSSYFYLSRLLTAGRTTRKRMNKIPE
jgi:hypothetical protein